MSVLKTETVRLNHVKGRICRIRRTSAAGICCGPLQERPAARVVAYPAYPATLPRATQHKTMARHQSPMLLAFRLSWWRSTTDRGVTLRNDCGWCCCRAGTCLRSCLQYSFLYGSWLLQASWSPLFVRRVRKCTRNTVRSDWRLFGWIGPDLRAGRATVDNSDTLN